MGEDDRNPWTREFWLRPIVLYIKESYLLLVVGTSAVVQPVASFPLIAKQAGALVVEVNMDLTPLSSIADASFQGKAGEILPALLEKTKGHR
jgi:NAD-dependent deacetylase